MKPTAPSSKLPFVLLGIFAFLILVFGALNLVKSLNVSKNVTLTYWGLWEPESVMRPLLDKFETDHPNIKVNYVQQSAQEYRERLLSAISQGKGPDVFRIHSSWVPMFRTLLAPVPDTDFASFYPTANTDLLSGKRHLAIPLEFDGLVMYVNDTLLAASGQSVPEDWDQLRTTAVAASRCTSETGACTDSTPILTSGVALGTADNVDHWQDIVSLLMLQNRVDFTKLDQPSPKAAQDALDYYTSFSKDLHIWSSSLPTSTSQFISGKLAIYFAPSWRILEIKQAAPKLKFSIHPVPQVALDVARQEQPINLATYWVEGISAKSRSVAAATELLTYLSSKDVQSQFFASAVASGRLFGEPYSRVDLAASLQDSEYLAPLLSQAPTAKSSYLASSTQDGTSGINSKLSTVFASTINGTTTLAELATSVTKILADYGLAVAPPVSK